MSVVLAASPSPDPTAPLPPRPAFGRGFRLRLITALLAAPPVLALVWLGGWPLRVLVAAALMQLWVEWLRLVPAPEGLPRGRHGQVPLTPGGPGGLGVGLLLSACLVEGLIGFLPALAVLTAAVLPLRLSAARRGWPEPARLSLGLLYFGGSGLSLLALRGLDQGLERCLMLLVITWSADSAAMIGGRLLGGPRLWPRLSPNKTWAGAGTGCLAAGLAGAAMAAGTGLLSLPAGGVSGAVLAWVGLAGDLYISALKRRAGVKDTGRLLPGHGGLLDRIDGLILILPVALLGILLLG